MSWWGGPPARNTMMTALCERPRPAAASARSNCGIERPPPTSPPSFRKSRRVTPSQKRPLPRPRTFSISSPLPGTEGSCCTPVKQESCKIVSRFSRWLIRSLCGGFQRPRLGAADACGGHGPADSSTLFGTRVIEPEFLGVCPYGRALPVADHPWQDRCHECRGRLTIRLIGKHE